MGYLRQLILKQSSMLNKEFSEKLLMKIWKDFLVFSWNSNMKFNIFQGKQCNIFSDEIYQDLWHQSKWQYEHKPTTEATHRDWCDLHNYGVTHFGVHPSLFPVSIICFDVFHLCC
jgi:hypothetical protein